MDEEPNALEVLEQGREAWRRRQTRAAVRDAPKEAVVALTALGCTVTRDDEPPAENLRALIHR